MSLDTLRQLRRAGGKPTGVLKVVVGRRNAVLDADADVISVMPADQPRLMDWRPVVGLPLALFVCEGHNEQAERVFDALMAAKCLPVGAVWPDVTVTSDEPSRPVLRRMWSLLCT